LKFDLSGSLRYEHFSDVGHALSPQLGFALEPMRSLSIQGSWARLFRAPNLPDLNEGPNVSQLASLADPQSPTKYTTVLFWSGNNANLRPEIAHSWSLGFTARPAPFPNVSASVSYFSINSTNRVLQTRTVPFDVLTNPQEAWLFDATPTPAERAQ